MNKYTAQLSLLELGVGGRLSTPRGMGCDPPVEHAAHVPLVDRDLGKSLLLLLGPYFRHERCESALLYPGLVRCGSGHMAGTSWHILGLPELDNFWDAAASCLTQWSKSRDARVCLAV